MSIVLQYFSLGWRVTPLLGKKPFLENWQNSRLNPEEFKKYGGCNVGIVTGWINAKLAVCALDVDEPLLIGFNPQPWLDKGSMAHTTSNALRIVFYTDAAEVASFSKKVSLTPQDLTEEQKKLIVKARDKQNVTILEVLGEGRQFMAPPSKHPDTGKILEWVVPPKPPEETLVIHSLEEFKTLLSASITRNKWVLEELFETTKTIAESRVLQNWLEKIKARLNIAGEGPNYVYCHCPFHAPDRNPSFALHKAKFYAVDYHTGEVFTLKQLAEKLGVELEGAKEGEVEGEEESKKRVIRAAFVELPDGRLAEEAYDGKQAFFLVYNPQNDAVERLESIELEGCIYKPIESPELEHGTVLLPSGVEEYGSDEQLLNDLIEYMNRWHEPPSVLSRQMDGYYAMFTYIKDLVPQLPYLRCLAPWGRGKSAWLDVV
ncbi:MAG: bifunctional DNA primase/polymerase, partial [Candidatus Bathyarchaeia archaeon]